MLWKGKSTLNYEDVFILGDYIENNAIALREQYLALVHDLGERKIADETVVEYLQVRGGFSIWWMTSLAEKCNYAKSPYIEDIIRLMALQMYMRDFDFEHIILESSDPLLINTLKDWCLRRRIKFTIVYGQLPTSALKSMMIDHAPQLFLGLGWLLRRLIKRWPLKGQGLDRWRKSDGRYSFFSYLFNFDLVSAQSSKFNSKYWGELPNLVSAEGGKSNWLHLYIEDGLFKRAKSATSLLNKLNENVNGQVHVTLDSFMNLRVLFKVMADWFSLRRRYQKTRNALAKSESQDFNYWFYFDQDWAKSICGHLAVSNLLHIALFEEALTNLPEQSLGVYLQEKQPWEFAAINAWRASSRAKIIGTPHTLVRFWDLRYFFDLRDLKNHSIGSIPRPDKVAVNGPAALEEYINSGYETSELAEIEALRFSHLNNNDGATHYQEDGLKLLVLGDFVQSNTLFQLDLLKAAVPLAEDGFTIVYKPHPICNLDMTKYSMLDMEVVNSDIKELSKSCDLAFTSSMSSAAVDAYMAGLPVISALDKNKLNLSPLRGQEDVDFVSSPQELAEKLFMFDKARSRTRDHAEFFWFDPNLSRWSDILGLRHK